jgi:F-type H+-transporting ATPase subunit a
MMGPGFQIFPAIDKPHVSLAAEKIFGLGPLNVTNSMITLFIVIGALVLFFSLATSRLRGGNRAAMLAAPRGAQNVAETIVELLLNLVENTAGKRLGRQIFPLIATLFIFILAANYTGLLPGVGTIGKCEPVHHAEETHAIVGPLTASSGTQFVTDGGTAVAAAEEGELSPGCKDNPGTVLYPFFRAPNADLNMTIAMALIAITTVQVLAIRAHGVGHYLKEFIAPPIPFLHVIGEFSRIISLSARLFGNIFGGEVLLAVIIALTVGIAWGVAGFIPAIFYGLELFFGLIQALLFSLLTLIYISVAAAGHDNHHADEHHHEGGVVGAIEDAAQDLAVGAHR